MYSLKKTDKEKLYSSRIEQSTRAESICDFIKRGLFLGYWKPGDKINDEEIASRLGVSRISVREALSMLIENKVIEKKHWKGYIVRKLSLQDVKSIIEIRLTLETLAFKKFIKKMSTELIARLESSVARAANDLKSMDGYDFRKTNFEFHEIIYEESGNQWLSDILQNLRMLVDNRIIYDNADDFQEHARVSIVEHQEIIRQLKKGDGHQALQLLKKHILDYEKRIRKDFF